MSDSDAPHRANAPPARNAYGAMCAAVYVLDKPPGALEDQRYYREQLGPLSGPILEAAAGSGRLHIPLLEAGLDLKGFDHSEHMMAELEAEAARRGLHPQLRRMRFQDFQYDEAFAAIICPVGAFTLIETFAEGLETLRRFHRHLQPGGRAFIDLMPLGYLAQARDSVRGWETPEGDLLRLDSRAVEIDWLGQRRVTHDRYERWRGGRLVEAELEVLSVRCWGLEEFRVALAAAGFAEINVCGNYQPGRPPRSTDRWWCFQAVKRA
jgi:SAM-dependent methyltransferase